MTYLHEPHRRAAHEDAVPPAVTGHGDGGHGGGSHGYGGHGGGGGRAGGPLGLECEDCDLAFGRHVHLHLRPMAAEVGRVRAVVGTALTAWGCPPGTVDDGRLLVSELVGNAVKYAPCTPITLDLMQIGDRLLIEVTDGSGAQPVVHRADPHQEQGRGMFLVQAIASAWGARRDRRGRKTTWCTLAVGQR
ncbi:ATP-binding protein [Streptomyces naganishii]|uniref:ATP-binding protein n=1 Tax=Streptomyces naganishii TaxID=285447 RepID=UPI00368C74CA